LFQRGFAVAPKSADQFADTRWNPIVGCSPVSRGCENCWAAEHAGERFYGATTALHYNDTIEYSGDKFVWSGKVSVAPRDILRQPLRNAAPLTILVCAMGDLFHEDVPTNWIDNVFAIMARAAQHTFILVTKRARRMCDYVIDANIENLWRFSKKLQSKNTPPLKPPYLVVTPAAKRVVVCEPLLAPVDLNAVRRRGGGYLDVLPLIDWVVIGGEYGRGARPMPIAAAQWLIQQCDHAKKPAFVTRVGSRLLWPSGDVETFTSGGAEMTLWPSELRVRQKLSIAASLNARHASSLK
jgi:protein gp37